MKKTISVFLAIILFFSTLSCVAFAKEMEKEIEYFDDGSYGVTIIEMRYQIKAMTNTISKSKQYTRYDNSNNALWMAKITATFTYNGTSATCTNVTKAYAIYNNNWQLTASSASKSGATATGNFTFKHYVLGIPVKTVNKTLTLTCDKNGNVS